MGGWKMNNHSWAEEEQRTIKEHCEEKEQRNKPTQKGFDGKLGKRKRGNSK